MLKVLIRRAQVPDELPGAYKLNAGQDIMISVYNIHHSSEVSLDSFCGSNAASLFECSQTCILLFKFSNEIFKLQ